MKYQDLAMLQIFQSESVKAAMKQMDVAGLKILFVVDKDRKLLGVVTDGNFRRWILKGKSLDASISKLFNKNPIKFSEDYDIEEIKQIMVKERLECVPIVDDNQRFVDALFWEDIFGSKYKKTEKTLNVPLVIIAGGEGTRLSPLTKILPKPLMPIGDKPVVEVIMDNFAEFGCKDFYLLLGYKGAMVQSYFDNAGNKYKPIYISENEPSGTAGALRFLRQDSMPDSFFVSNCDTIISADYADIYDFHTKGRYDITIIGAQRSFVIPYGVLETKTGGSIDKLIEKPEYDFLVNVGMYMLKKDILSLLPEKGVFHFTDLIKKAQKEKCNISVYPVSEKSWQDVGQLELLEKATPISAKRPSRKKTEWHSI